MGREVRMVPANWEHPKRENGTYQPMHDRNYNEEFNEWLEERNQWLKGFQKDFDNNFIPKEEEYKNMPFEDYAGAAPDSRYYMPQWPDSERNYFRMYETTSEGTPISPAFSTPEKLAKWLFDNNASSFASQTASYESWLKMIKGPGSSVSAILIPGKGLVSGVEGGNNN